MLLTKCDITHMINVTNKMQNYSHDAMLRTRCKLSHMMQYNSQDVTLFT